MPLDLLDPRLRERLQEAPTIASVRLRPPVPPSLLALGSDLQVVATSQEADAMADALGRLDVAFVGIDTEFRYGDPGDEDTFNEWQDLSALRPLVVSLAAMVRATDGAGYVPVRYSIDVRTSEPLVGLSRALALPLAFVTHHFKSEYFALKALAIPWPRASFCTWLAAQMLTLGRHHARYVDPNPADDETEGAAASTARKRRAGATSLLAQLNRYAIPYPFAGDKDAMRRRFARLTDSEPLSPTDHEYAVADAYGAAALYLTLRAALAEQGLAHHYDTIELPGAIALAEIEWEGVRVDRAKIQLARDAAGGAVVAYERKLSTYGFRVERARDGTERVMVQSVTERRRVFAELGLLPLFVSPGAASGYSFRRELLERHAAAHPAIDLLARHAKFSAVVRDPLFDGELVGADGRVHSWINPLGADSGRPSFKRPNLVGLGKILRPVVVPDTDGHELAEIDYIAQEVFIAAAHFGDEVLLGDCNRGDPYCEMIRRFCPEDLGGREVPTDPELRAVLGEKFSERRGQMKVLMLGTIYGMGDESIATQAHITLPQAKRMRERFFNRYSALAQGIELAERRLHERGYTQTVTGLRRHRGQTGPSSSWEKKWAVNAPIQGGGACVLKLLLPRLARYLAQHGGRVVLPIFDAVLIQYPRGSGAVVLPGAEALMIGAMRELFPGTQPRVDVNDQATSCWNKNGRADSIERFLEDPEFKP